jgi:hypothetical protein
VAEGGLNQMDRRSVVQGVAQPVRADRVHHPSLFRRPAHDYADAPVVQELSASGGENWLLRARISSDSGQFRPQRRGQGDGPRAAVLTEHRNLAGVPRGRTLRQSSPQASETRNPAA